MAAWTDSSVIMRSTSDRFVLNARSPAFSNLVKRSSTVLWSALSTAMASCGSRRRADAGRVTEERLRVERVWVAIGSSKGVPAGAWVSGPGVVATRQAMPETWATGALPIHFCGQPPGVRSPCLHARVRPVQGTAAAGCPGRVVVAASPGGGNWVVTVEPGWSGPVGDVTVVVVVEVPGGWVPVVEAAGGITVSVVPSDRVTCLPRVRPARST